MDERSILHIQDSQYCYAVNNNTVSLMLRTSSEDILDSVTLIYGNKYNYYKKQKRASLKKSFTDGIFDYYTVTLKVDDVRFVYIFSLVYQGKKYYFSEDGVSETYDFSLAYYNSFQLPFINSADVMQTVEWMKKASFYEIFTDRFRRGDYSKDDGYINLKWGDIPTPNSFAGGDLKGIIDKLDYLKNLGITAIYLTPIFKSSSNHKYDISDYYSIDGMFGDKEVFKKLVNEAHLRGMKVVLDAVFNHCSENLSQFQDVIKNGSQSPYYNWFIINGDKVDKIKGNYEHFGVCKYMPKLNTSNKEVQNFLNGVATYWIKEFDIDGWRLDVSDEVSHDFWRTFRKAVKAVKPDCIILGENWHDSNPFLKGDQFDAIMNYALTKACCDYFASGVFNAKQFANKLSNLYVRNTKQVNSMMLNLLDSHDTHRFYTLLNKDIDKLICALSVIYLHTGAPCIYYGTEIPLEGGYDPDCRRTMVWKDGENSRFLKGILRDLAKMRKHKEIISGDISFKNDNELFIMERTLKSTVRLTINNSGAPQAIQCSGKILLCHNFMDNKLKQAGFIIEKRG